MPSTKVEILITAKDMASGVFRGLGVNVKKVSSTFGTQMKDIHRNSLIASAAIVGVGVAVGSMAVQAGKIESVRDAFHSMVTSWGFDARELIDSTKAASRNTLSEAKIMREGLKAMSLIGSVALGDLTEMFPRLATIAKKAARVTGQDVSFMLESITTGIGRTSTKWLDNTGIVINASAAYAAYADQLGINAKELDENQRKTAILNTWLQKAEETYKDVEVSAGGMSGGYQELTATIDDMLYGDAGIITTMLPAFTDIVRAITPIVREWGPKLSAWVKDAIRWFTDLDPRVQAIITGAIALAPVLAAIGVVLIPVIASVKMLIGIFGILSGVLAGPAGLIFLFGTALFSAMNWLTRRYTGAGILDQVKALIDVLTPRINTLIDRLSELKRLATSQGLSEFGRGVATTVRSAVGSAAGLGPYLPEHGTYARFVPTSPYYGGPRQFGGLTQPGRGYLVGEKGPEMFEPFSSGRIKPGAGGAAPIFNVYIGMYAGTALEKRRIAEELFEEMRFVARTKGKSILEGF